MENKLDILTKKLYDEGVGKANQEAEIIIREARKRAEEIVAEAERKSEEQRVQAQADAEHMKKKVESEMALAVRQAIAALKQEVTGLVSGKVAGELAKAGFDDKKYVQELLLEIVKKWDAGSGNLNLEVLLPAEEKERFVQLVTEKYKSILDKGLNIKVGNQDGVFVLQPADGSYQIAFSEELFQAFFDQYLRGFAKELLYK